MRHQWQIEYLSGSQSTLLAFILFMPLLLMRLTAKRLAGYRLIHIHWIWPFYVPSKVPFSRQLTFVQVLTFFAVLRLLRFRVVWTVHNVVPQFSQTPNDAFLMRALSRLARIKIIHSEQIRSSMQAHGLNTDNVRVIPHGSYIGVYPGALSRTKARAQLGLDRDDQVILFFGHLAPYKGVDDLLATVRDLPEQNVRLVLAGICADPSLRPLIAAGEKSGRVAYHDGHITADRVASYFAAADVVALPFKKITTSGSAILALSFGKAIVAPRLGGLRDIPETAGYFYDPKTPGALAAQLRQALNDPADLAQRGQRALSYAASISWDNIAAKTASLYEELLV